MLLSPSIGNELLQGRNKLVREGGGKRELTTSPTTAILTEEGDAMGARAALILEAEEGEDPQAIDSLLRREKVCRESKEGKIEIYGCRAPSNPQGHWQSPPILPLLALFVLDMGPDGWGHKQPRPQAEPNSLTNQALVWVCSARAAREP
ncbi:hypothetical protein CRG98_044939 [Punica granatum]|uniref:Uncharacterized protein n=1 Tax=Punica granatum TaxID=22663 RepID=A0A2I0HSH4_PUNGR|nr:hypothetical protein CRG98_044939 [Punica granatum]